MARLYTRGPPNPRNVLRRNNRPAPALVAGPAYRPVGTRAWSASKQRRLIRAIVEVASRARDHQFRVGGLNCLDVEVKTLFGHVIVFGTLGKVEEVFLVFRIVHGTLKVFSRELLDGIV